MRQGFVCLLLVFFCFFILSGCNVINVSPEPESKLPSIEKPEPDSEPPGPVEGGQLAIPVSQLDTFNPLLTKSKDMFNFFNLIYEGLFEYDENLKPRPVLVESWDVKDGGKTWEFRIRKGVKWHDGRELTGEDVVFTFELLRGTVKDNSGRNSRKKQQPAWESFYKANIYGNKYIEGIEVKEDNPYTVIVTLNRPMSHMLDIMTFPVISLNIYKSLDFMLEHKDDTNLGLLVGTGPYRVDSTKEYDGKMIKLVRNDEWWGKKPYIDTILVKLYKNNEEARNAFKNGEVDLVDTTVAFVETYLQGREAGMYRYLTQNYDFIAFNFKRPSLLDDRRLRQAIAYSINRKDIITRVYFSNAQAVDVPIPTDSWLYDPDSRIYDFEPSKASKILSEAGWNDSDGDGILDRIEGGQKIDLRFTLVTNEDNSLRKEVAELVREQLRNIGIDMQIMLFPWEEFKLVLAEGNFDAALAGYYLDFFPDLQFALHSAEIGNGLNNFIGYNSEEMDKLIERASMDYEPVSMKKTFVDIQKHLTRELPFISLYFQTATLMVDRKVQGIESPRELQVYRDIEDWYLIP